MCNIEIVYNWEDRIKDYSDEVKKQYRRMFEAEKEYEALLVDDTLPWKLALDQKKKG